jgi:hypothetical protein
VPLASLAASRCPLRFGCGTGTTLRATLAPGRARPRRRCGMSEPSPDADVERGEPSPGADVV